MKLQSILGNKMVSSSIINKFVSKIIMLSLKAYGYNNYKNFKSKPVDKETLESNIAIDPKDYDIKVNESNLDNYKNFFNNSYLETIDMRNDQIRLKKAFADPIVFEFKDFGTREEVLTRLDEKINVNEFAEIIFLCKYIGDYNITKYGDKLMFENANNALILKRLN